MKVHIFIPCGVDLFFPEIGVKMVRILRQQSCEVVYNTAQVCCGKYAMYMGMEVEAKRIGQKYIKDFFVEEPIVCPDSACVGYLKKHLHQLGLMQLENVRAVKIQDNLYELTDFLVNVLGKKKLEVPYKGTLVLPTYPIESPRHKTLLMIQQLLKVNDNLKVIRAKKKGFEVGSDILPLTARKLSRRLLRQYKDYLVEEAEANFFVDADVNALQYLKQYLQERKVLLKMMHTTDLLLEGKLG